MKVVNDSAYVVCGRGGARRRALLYFVTMIVTVTKRGMQAYAGQAIIHPIVPTYFASLLLPYTN